ncbi:hypothetical protein ACA910_007313 [Epithemia clementina (nom. ined.)]
MNRGIQQEENDEQEDAFLITGGNLEPDPSINTACPGSLFTAPLLSTVVSLTCCLPFYILACCGFFEVKEKEIKAVLYFGKYIGSVQEPGIHFLPICGLETRPISTATRTVDLKDLKVLDQRGNPVVISAVVTFVPTSAKKARIDVQNPWPYATWQPAVGRGTYLQLQAEAILKQVASQFPYEAPAGQPSLQTEGSHITAILVQRLQERVNILGAHIMTFDLVDLSYAPEIAQSMLLRQQAEALVDARRIIVAAAVDMATDALTHMQERGCLLDDATRQGLVSNLMTVICSHTAVTPTVSVGSGDSGAARLAAALRQGGQGSYYQPPAPTA